jgi:hypothetical protein
LGVQATTKEDDTHFVVRLLCDEMSSLCASLRRYYADDYLVLFMGLQRWSRPIFDLHFQYQISDGRHRHF